MNCVLKNVNQGFLVITVLNIVGFVLITKPVILTMELVQKDV